MTFEQYEQEVKRHLTDKRFFHSQCVAAEAARLAQRYGADVEKARLAGILHDIMKDTPPEQQLKILRDSGIILTKTQSRNRKLWHALAGAAYLRGALGVSDEEIVSAVACHTSGKGDMSLLEKIVWLSDYIEPGRKQAPNLPEIRRIAFEDLDKALVMALENTLSYLKGGNMEIDSMTQKTYDFYKNGGNV